MNLPSRVCAFAAFISCIAHAPVFAEVPSAPPTTAPAPAPTPTPTAAPSAPASVGDTTTPAAPIDPAKEAEVRKLLAVTGTVKMVDLMKKQILATFRQRASMLPPEFWDRLDKDMDPQQLIEKLMPIYDKYYSLDDLKALNAFYQTPAGQHLLQNQQPIVKDSMAIGQDWARQAGLKVMLEMQDYQQRMSSQAPSSNNTPKPEQPAPAPSAQ